MVPLLLVAAWRVVRRYRPSSRETQRLLAVAKSPIYASCTEALNGLATIRAFGASARLKAHHREMLVKVRAPRSVASHCARAAVLP